MVNSTVKDDGMKVLMVDDEENFLEQAKLFLNKENKSIQVETVTSPEKAFKVLENSEYDAIIADYQMPDLDGLELLEKVKEDLNYDTPFIMLTGKGREEVAIEALNLGADRYLQKGGDPKSQYSVLAKAINQGVKHYRAEEDLVESEERYRRLFESAQDGMLILDAETGEIKDANPYIQDLLGYSKEELVGKELWQIGTFKDIAENKERFKELVNKDFIRYEDMPLKTKNGKKASVEFVSNTYQAGGKKVVQCNIRDITERKEKEEELKQSKKKYSQLFNSIRDAILVADTDRNIISCNPAFTDLFGYELEEIKGKKTNYIYHDEEQFKEMGDKIREHMGDRNFFYTIDYEKKNGEVFPGETNAFYLKNEEEIKGFIGLIRNISERKKKEKELQKRRKKYENIFHETPLGAFHYDSEGKITECNDKFVEIIGSSREQLIGLNMLKDLKNEELINEVRSSLEEGEGYYEGKYTSLTGNKTTHVRVFFKGIKNEKNKIKSGISLVEDITERMEAENRLSLAQKFADVGIWEYDIKNDFLYWNPECEQLFGLEEGEFGGKFEEFLQYVHPEDKDIVIEKHESILEASEGVAFDFEHRIVRKDGETRWVREKAKPVKNSEGEIGKIIGMIMDITERKKMEEKNQYLHSLLRHIIREKANIIQGYQELLKECETVKEGKSFVEKTENNCKDIREITGKVDILHKAQDAEVKEISVNSILDEVIVRNRDQASDKGIEIELKKTKSKVLGGSLLEDLFQELIENSIKHSNCTKIQINTKEKNDECVVSVEDDGKGIPDQKKNKIFQIGFRQGDSARSGIGLHLVKEIAESYKGRIEVKDSSLGGARFDVHLLKP